MKSICSWYERGHVYFERFDEFRVSTELVHLFTFCELASYVDRFDPSKNRDVLIVGEDPFTVDVCFLGHFDKDYQGSIRPTHVLKSRVEKKEHPTQILSKREVMTFLLNAGYISAINDETMGFA